ncbi:MAG: glycosyltransferase family 2 protein [Candidatus Methanofastidiosia archaeon]
MKLSIVIPVLNEEANLKVLYESLKEVLENFDSEIVFVDDGSSDSTFEILKKLHEIDERVRVIRFRKNFGQTSAIQAGIEFSRGDVIVTMDSDLQNDPRDIPKLLKRIGEFDVVSGWRKERKDSFLKKRVPSHISNFLARKLTGVEIHDFGCTLKAYRREALKDLKLFGETHRYIPALVSWKGYSVSEVVVGHRERGGGKSKYDYKRLFKGFLDLINIKFLMSYSSRPLHFFGFLGLLQVFFGGIIGLYLATLRLFYSQSIQNRPLLLLAILLMVLGIQFITMGFLSEIIIRIYYTEEKPYKIREVLS